MATGGGDGSLALILKDFEHWLETTPDAQIFLLQVLLTPYGIQLYMSRAIDGFAPSTDSAAPSIDPSRSNRSMTLRYRPTRFRADLRAVIVPGTAAVVRI